MMVTVSGRLLDFVEDPSRVTNVQVRAKQVTPHGDGLMLDQPVPAEWDPIMGTVSFQAAAGTVGFISWVTGGKNHVADGRGLIIPDKPTATLRECVEAVLLASEATLSQLERLALEVAEGVARVGTSVQVGQWATDAKAAATEAEGIVENLPSAVDEEVGKQVPPAVTEAIRSDQSVAAAVELAVSDAAEGLDLVQTSDTRLPQVREHPDWAFAVSDGDRAAMGITTDGDVIIPRVDESTRDMLLDRLGPADALHRSDVGLDVYPWRVTDEDGAVPLAVNHDGAVDFRRLTRESKAALLGTHDAITYGESETDQYPFRVVDRDGRAGLAVRGDGAVDFRRLTPEAVAYIASIGRESSAPDPVWVPEPGGTRATYYPTGDSLTIPGTPAKTATVAGALTWEDSEVGWWQKTPADGPWKIAETTRLAAWGSSSMFRLQRGLEAQLPGQGVTDILLGGGSGDRAEEIMWRMGMYEYHLAQEVTIPAEGSVTLTFAEGIPPGVRRVTDGPTAGTMPGSLGGVHGRITLNTSGVITFTRTTAGEQVTVPAEEEFEPDGRKYRDALVVLNIGKNNISGAEGDGRAAYEATVTAEQWLRSLAGRHLIMGHFNNWLWEDGDTRFREVAEANRLMAEHYGDRYIDLHGYIVSDQIWADTGITPTDQDRADQDRGVIAHSLSADGSHADYAVSDVIVQKLIIGRMIQKGWL